jgi:hypothetical protein
MGNEIFIVVADTYFYIVLFTVVLIVCTLGLYVLIGELMRKIRKEKRTRIDLETNQRRKKQ